MSTDGACFLIAKRSEKIIRIAPNKAVITPIKPISIPGEEPAIERITSRFPVINMTKIIAVIGGYCCVNLTKLTNSDCIRLGGCRPKYRPKENNKLMVSNIIIADS